MIRTLTEADFEAIHIGFVGAFSDYVVPMKPAADQLRSMFVRRGWVPELSVASFEGGVVTGFVINCLSGDHAYNTGTGTLPTHRRSGLARELMKRSMEILPARTYTLEVISTNEKAVALYRSLGFEEMRRLDAWSLNGAPPPRRRLSRKGAAEAAALHKEDHRETWWTSQPSWQNSTSSILRARDPYIVLGDDDGYIIVFPDNGDVPQIAVRPERRRQGIGRALVAAAFEVAQKPLRFINTDASDAGLTAFLQALGATRLLTQLEMRTKLDG